MLCCVCASCELCIVVSRVICVCCSSFYYYCFCVCVVVVVVVVGGRGGSLLSVWRLAFGLWYSATGDW